MSYFVYPMVVQAHEFSRTLYQLSRPNPDPKDVTTQWLPVIEHEDGRGACQLIDGDAYISPDADATNIVALMENVLNDDEQVQAINTINGLRGGRATLAQVIPQPYLDTAIDDAQMIADGWPVENPIEEQALT